jgi:hypothetical protein
MAVERKGYGYWRGWGTRHVLNAFSQAQDIIEGVLEGLARLAKLQLNKTNI